MYSNSVWLLCIVVHISQKVSYNHDRRSQPQQRFWFRAKLKESATGVCTSRSTHAGCICMPSHLYLRMHVYPSYPYSCTYLAIDYSRSIQHLRAKTVVVDVRWSSPTVRFLYTSVHAKKKRVAKSRVVVLRSGRIRWVLLHVYPSSHNLTIYLNVSLLLKPMPVECCSLQHLLFVDHRVHI